MDLDARGIVPRPWQSLLRALIASLVLHALNNDGAPDGTSIYPSGPAYLTIGRFSGDPDRLVGDYLAYSWS